MEFDPAMLARIQFAFTVSFHIIFPSFTIGLAAYIATLELLWIGTGHERYHRIARFLTKIFAVSFAMGVVSGIVLSYQFGTNWSHFSRVVGNVIGPLIGYEVLTAFFLEATFLGIMLFGWNRVPRGLHVFSCVMVALGTTLSAFWILSANSWMQTPAGHEIIDGVAHPVDWLAVIFNPSFPYRLAHMVTACYLTTAFVVLAVGARYVYSGRYPEDGRTMMRMALGLIAILAPLQAFIGDAHGLNTLKHQPAKIAAIEAHWENEPGATGVPLVLFALPNDETERNDYQIAIPHLGSLILTHSWTDTIKGLKEFPRADRPPVAVPFFAFRVMVGLGILMILVGWLGVFLLWRRRLFETDWYLAPLQHIWPIGFVTILSGWFVTEVGRQPWVAYGILRTADAISPVDGWAVATTLALFVFVYGIVFSGGIYYINRLIAKGPEGAAVEPPVGVPTRPLASAHKATRAAINNPGE
ncbi:cytochrome ubiquinol oxidase subunit I [Ancylobacter rudongensis]|uniref:Cytochrome bd-I ubiquinol oxidase subunit 1 apoprotein n=1 Tax=Ancylobacter rudongensis TaxID=177413 RepID=A0A1G4TBB9_9HYPH|nr:cytochrome ubiquinol oxidase subunit I [Ancylobacter rudongensis]SCW78722.1 cytochrome bd-I ubiquinol oxidase subunit 1 apoprotein [Ancylobacter rudongensis]